MIEDAATSFNFVYETCAIGIEDARHGHIIKLYVMLSKTYKGSQEEAKRKSKKELFRVLVYIPNQKKLFS